MRNQLRWSIAILLGALALAAFMVALRPEPVAEERIEQVPLVVAIAFEKASGAIPVVASGTVQPREEVVIGVQVSGRLSYVNPAFREGSVVPAGATLLRIEDADYQNQVRIAEADVAAQTVAVLQAEEEVEIARDELRRFAQREGRVGTLTPLIDNSDYAARLLPPEQSTGEVPTAVPGASSRNTDSAGLATREPQLRSAKAALDRAEANLAVAQLSLERTRVSAPFHGVVREESAAVGTLVQPGQALGSIVSTASYEVRLSLTQDEAALIAGLLEAKEDTIAADVFYEFGGLTYRWPVFVDRVDGILDTGTRNVEVFLRVPSPLSGGKLANDDTGNTLSNSPPLLLGAFVTAEIAGTSLDSYATIPANALRPGNEIWVVREGKLEILPVRVIQRSDDIAYITTASLDQGGSLVISSLAAPTDGMPVRVSDGAGQ